jgi:glycosyltransferase involved in cell wall biosynthesis
MMRTQPKLSIGIPVYNGEKFIDELLMNLQAQTFKNFEILICDNASNDSTQEICKKHARQDSRIHYYRNDVNIGASANFDKVFSLSRAEFFKWAACDDLLESTYLEKCLKILRENTDVVGAHSLPLYVNARCEPFSFDPGNNLYIDSSTGAKLTVDPIAGGESRFPVIRFIDTLFSTMCLKIYGVFRRKALECSRFSVCRPKISAADKAILLEMALLGRFVHVNEKLFITRFHPGGSGALSNEELRRWLAPESKKYSMRLLTLLTFLSAPIGKPVNPLVKLACFSCVCAYGLKFLPIALRGIGLLRTPDDMRVAMLGRRPS